MSTPPRPTAGSISVRQTVDLLARDFAAVSAAVADGQYTFWLGSGVSLGRAIGLPGVVERVLAFLQSNMSTTNPDCEFRSALEQALRITDLPGDALDQLRRDEPIGTWPLLDQIVTRLVGQYSELLDIRFKGERDDFLLWRAVDVASMFPRGLPPDCEHYCLGILVLEGAISRIASANWDALIESSVAELSSDPDAALAVCIRGIDFQSEQQTTRLLKFHGCAVLAGEDEKTYREYLVASATQIIGWPHEPRYEVMRHELKGLAMQRPTFMVGLSAQDSNIKDLFAEASQTLQWRWQPDEPRHIFAGNELTIDQLGILKTVYREDYTEYGPEISRKVLIGAYAQQLLLALVLHVLSAKMVAYLQLSNRPNMPASESEKLEAGIAWIRGRVADAAEPDRLGFVRQLTKFHAGATALFRDGLPATQYHYRPLTALPVGRIASENSIVTSGIPELAAGLALLGLGEQESRWSLGIRSTGAMPDTLTVSSAAGTATLFFVANGLAATRLIQSSGLVKSQAADVVIVHSGTPVRRKRRSPRGRFGRTNHAGPRHVAMGQLLDRAHDADGLMLAFRQAAVL